MQTYVPDPESFIASLSKLSDKHLGKQRVDAFSIWHALHDRRHDWYDHPAVTMWRGHGFGLVMYGLTACNVWVRRGHADTLKPGFDAKLADYPEQLASIESGTATMDDFLPPWWGFEPIHASHRAHLLSKDRLWYGQFGWTERPNPQLVWP